MSLSYPRALEILDRMDQVNKRLDQLNQAPIEPTGKVESDGWFWRYMPEALLDEAIDLARELARTVDQLVAEDLLSDVQEEPSEPEEETITLSITLDDFTMELIRGKEAAEQALEWAQEENEALVTAVEIMTEALDKTKEDNSALAKTLSLVENERDRARDRAKIDTENNIFTKILKMLDGRYNEHTDNFYRDHDSNDAIKRNNSVYHLNEREETFIIRTMVRDLWDTIR